MKYSGNYTKEISFPLGGIGTGSIGLGGDGRFIDWEIFNRPSKGSINGYTHFAIRAIKDGKIIPALLNGDMNKGFIGEYSENHGSGPNIRKLCGFPHFENVEFDGEFPFASIDFKDKMFPANVKMTAFNPFIPLDSKNSSIPAAFFELEVENTQNCEMKYQIAFTLENPFPKGMNKHEEKNGFRFITARNTSVEKDDVNYGELTIGTDCENVYYQTYWYRGFWQENLVSYWNELSNELEFKDRNYDTEGVHDLCTLLADIDVLPHKKKKVRFVLSWNVPNNYNYWSGEESEEVKKPWKNYYATVFNSSYDSAFYSLTNWNDLYKRTMLFKNSLHQSTLPESVIDAASANLSVLKSPTVLRLEDGTFYGWEGVNQKEGSCHGTCQHVWNYAYALCFLFPDLERSIREMEFNYSTDIDGRMPFRVKLPLGTKMNDFRACVDGQMGTVIKCYREWKISGDNDWLKDKWEIIKKVLEYAWSEKNPDAWDLNKDGVLEGRQHHTLDLELFGPSSWLEGMYLAALKAASEMAEFLQDYDKAKEYREIYDKGYKWTKENLFNGKYFIQKVDLSDKSITDRYEDASERYWHDEIKQIKYQLGEGSSIDQMLAQSHADIIGLGDIFDRDQVDSALSEMMKNNFKPSMRYFTNYWRVFSVNDEAGSIICDFPEGVEKPRIPVAYCEETMTGFEYSFGGLLLSRGKFEDGIKVVKAVRDRFDGEKRNPWNEFECGNNYARSMASYALIPILSGFEFDMPNNHIGFNPYKTNDFMCIWSLADAWGNFSIDNKTVKIDVYEGNIELKSLGLKFCDDISSLKIDGKSVDFEFKNGIIYFKETNISKSVEITL